MQSVPRRSHYSSLLNWWMVGRYSTIWRTTRNGPCAGTNLWTSLPRSNTRCWCLSDLCLTFICEIVEWSLACCQITQSVIIFTARCYAERGYEIVCRLSVRPCVRNFQIPWSHRLENVENILWLNILRHLLTLTPTWAIWYNENTPKIRVE